MIITTLHYQYYCFVFKDWRLLKKLGFHYFYNMLIISGRMFRRCDTTCCLLFLMIVLNSCLLNSCLCNVLLATIQKSTRISLLYPCTTRNELSYYTVYDSNFLNDSNTLVCVSLTYKQSVMDCVSCLLHRNQWNECKIVL